jgi:hypothetical protein
MVFKAIVSGHIYLDETGEKDIEILYKLHNDHEYTGVFDDIDHALKEQIEADLQINDDYYFLAIVKSEFVEYKHWEGSEWDVEHEVIEIRRVEDINI